MTARSPAVSRAGVNRWRPAPATGPAQEHAAGPERGDGGGRGAAHPRSPERERHRRKPRRARGPRPCSGVPVQPFGGSGDRRAADERYVSAPLLLKHLVPDEVRFILERDARLLVPVGTCEQHGPHLPLGCDTIIVEHLADDLSAELQILRAPTVESVINSATAP